MTSNTFSGDNVFNPSSPVKLAKAATYEMHSSDPFINSSLNKASEKGAVCESLGPFLQTNEVRVSASNSASKAVTEGLVYNPPSLVKLAEGVACDFHSPSVITNLTKANATETVQVAGDAFPRVTFKPNDSIQINSPTANQLVSEIQISKDTEQYHSIGSSDKISCKKELFAFENNTNSASSSKINTPKTHKCNKLKTALKITHKKTPSSQAKLPDAFTRSSRNRLQEGCLTRSRSDSLRGKRLRTSPTDNGLDFKKAK